MRSITAWILLFSLIISSECHWTPIHAPQEKRSLPESGNFLPSYGHSPIAVSGALPLHYGYNPWRPIVGAGTGSLFAPNLLTHNLPAVAPSRHTVSTVNNAVPFTVPHPVPIHITRTFPVPIHIPIPVNIPRPVHVPVPQAVPVDVPRPVPVDVPRPVGVPVQQRIPVEVTQHVGIPVPQPIPVNIPVPQPVPVNIPVPQPVPVNIPIPQQVPIAIGLPPLGLAGNFIGTGLPLGIGNIAQTIR